MESKACVANKFSILGFKTSFGFKLIMYFKCQFLLQSTNGLFGLILRKSTLFLRRGNKNTIVSVLRYFTCELCPCELYPVILTCERYTFISRLSSPSSLESSALWKKKWKRRRKLLEEAGNERQQTSNIKTTVLQYMLEAPWRCTILCFPLANCDGIN